MTTTFIIGNGLGMALDPEIFSLERALSNSWGELSGDCKKLIKNISGNDHIPKTEYDLQHIQRLCWYLENAQQKKDIVDEIYTYYANVAKQFFDVDALKINDSVLINSLCQYVRKNENVHIATINYDKLLYGTFSRKNTKNSLFNYVENGHERNIRFLVDGCIENENKILIFDKNNINNPEDKYGWYLHLHGTPLFQEENNILVKKRITEVERIGIKESFIKHHIVLTTPRFKKNMIDKSGILSFYWEKFEEIISKTNLIYFIGYSGSDPHINSLVKKSNAKMIIIEWDFDHPNWYKKEHRKLFWQSKLNREKIELYAVKNINDFDIHNPPQE